MFDLTSAIVDYRARGKTHFHAIADNFEFEERSSADRLSAYAAHRAPGSDPGWEGHHRAYVAARINLSGSAVPETFHEINRPAHLGEIDGNQTIVRLEEMDWILKALGIPLSEFAH